MYRVCVVRTRFFLGGYMPVRSRKSFRSAVGGGSFILGWSRRPRDRWCAQTQRNCEKKRNGPEKYELTGSGEYTIFSRTLWMFFRLSKKRFEILNFEPL